MNLHELPQESPKAGDREGVCQTEAERLDPLFPMPAELPDDVLDVIFINQEIPLHDSFHRAPAFVTAEDLQLIIKSHLRIRDKRGRDQRVGNPTLAAKDTLDRDVEKAGEIFHTAVVVTIADQTALFAAGALNPMELKAVYSRIVRSLGKAIANINKNRYHSLAGHARVSLRVNVERQERLAKVYSSCLFLYVLKLMIT